MRRPAVQTSMKAYAALLPLRLKAVSFVMAVPLISGILVSGCGMSIRKDLTHLSANEVVFDDLCNVQTYHDERRAGLVPAPQVLMSSEVQGAKAFGGKTRFLITGSLLLSHVRRLLAENWSGVPESIRKASRVELQVRWSEKAGTKRVVTEEPAKISDGHLTFELPYHVCLSEFLFGADLYRTRRMMLGLPDPVTP